MSEPAISLDDAGYRDLRAVADRLLETTRVENMDEGVQLIMNPSGDRASQDGRAIVDDAKRAFYTGAITLNWAADENYQWDLPDVRGRFYIPPMSPSSIPMRRQPKREGRRCPCVEVTSSTSPVTVLNDRTTKPAQ